MVEWVKYSAYGIPFGLPKGDINSDGDIDLFDYIAIAGYGGAYDVRYDLNLDGLINSTDTSIAGAAFTITLGWGNLSDVGNRKGFAGYELDPVLAYNIWHIRNRVFNSDLGMWMTRDPLEYVDRMNLYEYGLTNPTLYVDPYGLKGGLIKKTGWSYVSTKVYYSASITCCCGGPPITQTLCVSIGFGFKKLTSSSSVCVSITCDLSDQPRDKTSCRTIRLKVTVKKYVRHWYTNTPPPFRINYYQTRYDRNSKPEVVVEANCCASSKVGE